ncbi:hypothetical protein ABTG41_00265, partial [Acinetobacter baumannii]
HIGFIDRTWRNNHQLNCQFRFSSSVRLCAPSYTVNNEKPSMSSVPFTETTSFALPMNNSPTPVNGSVIEIPDDDQKMISELMSFYDSNIQQNSSFDSGNFSIGQNPQKPAAICQQDDGYFKQGTATGSNSFQEAHVPLTNSVFPSTEFQFEQSNNSLFHGNMGENTADFQFSSPFDFTPVDYSIDALPKQEVSLWYL